VKSSIGSFDWRRPWKTEEVVIEDKNFFVLLFSKVSTVSRQK
jgi:hypothetical protein